MRFITWLNENLSMVELSIRQFITWQYLLPFNKNECITLIWRRQNIYKIIVLNTWEIFRIPFQYQYQTISYHFKTQLLFIFKKEYSKRKITSENIILVNFFFKQKTFLRIIILFTPIVYPYKILADNFIYGHDRKT